MSRSNTKFWQESSACILSLVQMERAQSKSELLNSPSMVDLGKYLNKNCTYVIKEHKGTLNTHRYGLNYYQACSFWAAWPLCLAHLSVPYKLGTWHYACSFYIYCIVIRNFPFMCTGHFASFFFTRHYACPAL